MGKSAATALVHAMASTTNRRVASDPAITKAMRLTLAELVSGPATATDIGCSIATLCALERRKLIRVETSFNAIAFPRRALAYITDAGRRLAGRR